MSKYSFNELTQIKTDINTFIGEHEQLSRVLLFKLRQNSKKIDSALELIQEDFEYMSESQQEKARQYDQDKVDLIKKYGGKIEQRGQQYVIAEDSPQLPDEFYDELGELTEEHRETLEAIKTLNKTNNEIAKEKVAEVNFNQISLESFPEILGSTFTDSFLEFVTVE